MYGLNYKDDRKDALAWLARLGNPYTKSIMDRDGRIGINYGVYGVPETYVIDKKGVIRSIGYPRITNRNPTSSPIRSLTPHTLIHDAITRHRYMYV